MTNYTKWMISIVILMITIIVFVIWLIQDRFFETTEELTIDEASQIITKLYGGSVESFEEKDDIFYLRVVRNNLTYDFQIDSETGNILQLSKVDGVNVPDVLTHVKTVEEIRTLLNSQQNGTVRSITYQDVGEQPHYVVDITEQEILKTLIVNAITGEIISEEVKQQNSSNSQTVTIISSEKAKQIALSQLKGTVNFVVFEGASDGGFYLVEINASKQKATFQIHAVSGKVMSVTKQNNDDEDEDGGVDDTDDDADDNDSEKDDDD